jgi:hypothetical protein
VHRMSKVRRRPESNGASAGISGDAVSGSSKNVATRIVSVVPGLKAL